MSDKPNSPEWDCGGILADLDIETQAAAVAWAEKITKNLTIDPEFLTAMHSCFILAFRAGVQFGVRKGWNICQKAIREVFEK